VSHLILENCVGCGICAPKCPTREITGKENSIYYIDSKHCIDCGVCGVYCPVEAVVDASGMRVKRIDQLQMPKARVEEELCSACEYCVDICPFDCITLRPRSDPSAFFKAAFVDEKLCVGCGLCEKVCSKGSIRVGRSTESIAFAPDRSS
jgi:Na+-translocating ferredoxin:NAD+ oxidoreductase subunit B